MQRGAKSWMFILIVLCLPLMHQVASQLQCPQVSAGFGDDLDVSSFSVMLDQPENVGDDRNSNALSDGAGCKSVIIIYRYSIAFH